MTKPTVTPTSIAFDVKTILFEGEGKAVKHLRIVGAEAQGVAQFGAVEVPFTLRLDVDDLMALKPLLERIAAKLEAEVTA